MEFLSLEKFFLRFHLPHQPLPDQLPKLPLSPKMFVTKPCFPSRCSKPPWLSKECRWALVNDDLWLSAGQGRSGHGWWVQWLACSYFVAPTFCFSSRFIFDFSSEKGSPAIWAPLYVCQPPLGWDYIGSWSPHLYEQMNFESPAAEGEGWSSLALGQPGWFGFAILRRHHWCKPFAFWHLRGRAVASFATLGPTFEFCLLLLLVAGCKHWRSAPEWAAALLE